MVSSWIIPTVLLLAEPDQPAQLTFLQQVKTAVDIVGTLVTALAVIIGGLWVYFKFAKGRTFRPRIQVDLAGEWLLIDQRTLIQLRVTVKNIGGTKVQLVQRGTGLRVSRLHSTPAASPPAPVQWESLRVFPLLTEHHWLEPGEAISDDLLLDLAAQDKIATLAEARLILKRVLGANIEVFARRVIPTDATIGDPAEPPTPIGLGKE
jgi:hypothetical protein